MQANTDRFHRSGAYVFANRKTLAPGLVGFDLIGLGAGEIADAEVGGLEATSGSGCRGCHRLGRYLNRGHPRAGGCRRGRGCRRQ